MAFPLPVAEETATHVFEEFAARDTLVGEVSLPRPRCFGNLSRQASPYREREAIVVARG